MTVTLLTEELTQKNSIGYPYNNKLSLDRIRLKCATTLWGDVLVREKIRAKHKQGESTRYIQFPVLNYVYKYSNLDNLEKKLIKI